MQVSRTILGASVSFALAVFSPFVFSATFTVADVDALEEALEEAEDGDTVLLKAGVYETNAAVTYPLIIKGEEGAVIDAGGEGSALTIHVPGVRVENLAIRGYGADLYNRNAGVRVMDGADDVVLEKLTIEGPGFGIRGDRMDRLTVKDCQITGDASMHVLDRGDGVYLNYVKDPVLRGNRVKNVRDGFYFENVENSVSNDNRFTGAQYGIHWMYTRGDSAAGNKAYGVRGGYALMSSERITLSDSESGGNIEFGILLNVADKCVVTGNTVDGVTNSKGNPALNTEGKGIFIYGPGASKITRNRIANADIGIGVALGGEGNLLWDNAFIDNRIQVRYVGEKPLEWSVDGKGNYWSTYLGWDLDRNGCGDRAYQPNDSLDRIFWIYPEARFLMDSPVVTLMRWMSQQFELDRGKGVTDSYPLMTWEPYDRESNQNEKNNKGAS